MTRHLRRIATSAILVALTLAAAACSPKAPAADQAVAATTSAPAATPSGSALPASCQSLLAAMQSCSDNLTSKGSPLGNQIRLSMTDMRTSIAGAPAAEVSGFCDTEASAFKQRAEAAHC